MKTPLFLFFLSFYLLIAGGHLGNFDAAREYYVARQMISGRGPSLPEDSHLFREEDGFRGKGGRLYSPTGLGYSLAMVPMLWAARGLNAVFPGLPQERTDAFLVSLLDPFFGALICVAFFCLLTELGFSLRKSLWLAVLFGLGTMLAPYSKSTFDIVPATLFGFAAALFLIRSRGSGRPAWFLLSGFSLGLGLLVRISLLVFLPALLGYVIWLIVTRRAGSYAAWMFLLPIVVGLVLVGGYNWIRFGSVFETGYAGDPQANGFATPLWVGLAGLLLSPGKGLFFYSPILLLFFGGIAHFARRRPAEAVLWAGVCLPYLVACSAFSSWSGDYCWGPRYLVLVLPFLFVPVAYFFTVDHGVGTKIGVALLIAASLGVQLLGTGLDPVRRIGYRLTVEDVPRESIYWSPAASPIVDHAQRITGILRGSLVLDSRNPTYRFQDDHLDFWFVYLPRFGVPESATLAGVIALLLAASAFGWKACMEAKGPVGQVSFPPP